MKIITAKEMARLDSASEVKPEILMERAGEGLADFISDYMPRYPVCFICGTGNNGGDGFVAARYLLNRGYSVEVYLIGDKNRLKELPRMQAEKLGIEIKELNADEINYILNRKKIVVDCILGTGFKSPLKRDLKKILEIINKKSKITISCDIPTGVNGDTGDADECSIDADFTVTFEYPKIGHLKKPGSIHTGSLEVVKIGIDLSPDEYVENTEFTVRQDCADYFSRRLKDTHKKDYGHILVIGGSPGMEGAVSMAACGALRTGAGLVTCAVGKSIAGVVSSYSMSAMTLSLDEYSNGYIGVSNISKILSFIEKRKIDSVVLGPGISTGYETQELTKELIKEVICPIVLDADGINNIVGAIEVIENRKSPLLITPHPGEMSRLVGKPVQENRLEIAKDFAVKTGCAVLLKGYRSIITDGKKMYINASGNPGMATGGTGDVLSGMAAALIGQGFGVLESARIATWLHGMAGDLSALNLGERYILPEDILGGISRV